jgi:hypothetical protein
VTFHCREVLTLLPILNFGGIQGNGWIQVGGQDFNWLGRGQTLGGYYRYDQRHSFDLHHRAPLLWGPWGLSAGVSRSATVENAPVLGVPQQVEVDRWAVTASGRYTRSPRLSFELGWGYLNERYAPQGQAVPAPAAYDKLLVKAVVSSDRIDYFFHYLDGPAGELTAEAVKTLDEPRIFWKLLGIGRYFRRLGSWGNLALRLRAGLSRNDDSPFVPFVLDSYLTVRGSGNQVARGTAELTLNAEYRGTLVQREWGAVQWVGFSDWSAWRKPAEDLRDMFAENNTVTFVGAGARVILSRLNFLVLRLDYGSSVTSRGDHGFVLGTGQYF